jgi:hypothetical protein
MTGKTVMGMNRKTVLWLAGLTAGAVLFGYVSLLLLTPSFGRVVGYADEQPPLRIVRAADPAPSREVQRVLHAAQQTFDSIPRLAQEYWPEPSAIIEREDCWRVEFTRRTPIYRLLGVTQTLTPTDRVMFMSIDKHSDTLRFGKWCE